MKVISLQVAPIYTNCYLLCDEASGVCAVIDPGGDAEQVTRAITETGCTPKAVLLTHGHFDHTGGVAKLLEKYPGIPVYLNSRDIYPPEDRRTRHLYPPVGVETVNYDEGDVIALGTLKIEVLATPGHSEGGVTLKCENVLICGDTLFAGSCGRSDLTGGDEEKLKASLRRLGNLEGDYQVYPGHMEASTLTRERETNFMLKQAMKG